MKKIFTLLLSVAMAGVLNAQTIAPKVAAQKAAGIFAKSVNVSGAKGMTASADPQLAYTAVLNGDTCFYVFNNPQGGYAIIGGDLASREVLATVDAGKFDSNKIPGNMKYMLDEYAQNISAAKGSVVTAANPTWNCGQDITSTIMSTHWAQGSPYCDDCPAYSTTEKCATGCVATAAAQAVYAALKNKLTTGRNSKTYAHSVTNSAGTKTTASQTYTATTAINWDMIDDYSEGAGTTKQKANVAKLMQIMGIISEMQYGKESAATSQDLQRGLYNNLGIAAKFKSADGMTDKAWEQAVYDALKSGPVIFGADTKSGGGHEFVIDGYRQSDDNFHVNWGWGFADGYFALTGTIATANGRNINSDTDKGEGSWMFPSEQGTGGSKESQDKEKETVAGSAYRYGHEMVYNLVLRDANSQDMPEVDADDASVSQESNKSASAKAMATTDVTTVPSIYVGDGTDATSDYKMKINFGSNGAKAGNNSKLIWAVMLEPVFAEGEEPDEYDCPILDATNGKSDETFTVTAGETIYGFDIPVGEYAWSEDGKPVDGEETIQLGKYIVTPIMYFDANPNDEGGYISDENIVYVSMPYKWKAPTVNFAAGTKPTTSIKTIESAANNHSTKAIKVIRKNNIVIEKDGKQFNAVGACDSAGR